MEAYYVDYITLSAAVVGVSGLINGKWLKLEGKKAWIVSILVSFAAAFVGYYFDFGFLSEVETWQEYAISGGKVALYAIGAFNIPWVKDLMEKVDMKKKSSN